jgi:hypothetical protein
MEKESKATPEQDQAATHVPLTEEQIRSAQLGVLVPLAGPVQIVDYDPSGHGFLSARLSGSGRRLATRC